MKNTLLIAWMVCLCAGCILPDRQRQVWLGGLQRTHEAQDQNIVRVYFDKWGDLYPDKKLHLPYKAFFDPLKKGNTYREKDGIGSLKFYYTKNRAAIEELTGFYGVSERESPEATFKAVESAIAKGHTAKINELLENSTSKTLVVFVHGFNDSDPTGDYQQIREAINKNVPGSSDDFVYLEVFWDGLTANQGDPSKSFIWGRSQGNSSHVGIGLRELLTEVKAETKVRVITHSLGASVATGALFDTNSKWRNNTVYAAYADTMRAPGQASIRLGMIAAAIPGTMTFKDFNRRGPRTVDAASNNIDRIVLGINEQDYALTKRAAGRYNSGIMGATSLGCNYKGEVAAVIQELQNRPMQYTASQAKELVQVVDFTNKGMYEKEHGLYYYFLQQDKVKEFIGKMFDD